MNRTIPLRHLPIRIACSVRAGVFLAAALGVTGSAAAQIKPRVLPPPPPPRRSAPPPSKPAPASAPPAAPAPAAQPGNRPANSVLASPVRTETGPLVNPGHPAQMQMHIAEWMEAHRNLPLAQQHQALEAEPGFQGYKPQEQAQMHKRLTQLNRMDPQKRNQTLKFTETMEHLAPPQRQQVRNVLGELGSLPEDRQHAVNRAYLQLRDLPEPERQAYINSAQFRGQFNDQERATVGNMVTAAPLLRMFQDQPAGPPKD